MRVRFAGGRELDKALAAIGKSAGRAVLHRVLKRAGQPIADLAATLAPDDPATGAPDLRTSMLVSTKLKNPIGNAEFAAVMSGGGTKAAARRAMRDARREATGGSFAVMHVGPAAGIFYAHLQEFGTAHHGPQPFMRPAFDAASPESLKIIERDLGDEIMKTAKRQEARRARMAAKGAK